MHVIQVPPISNVFRNLKCETQSLASLSRGGSVQTGMAEVAIGGHILGVKLSTLVQYVIKLH